LLDRFGRGALLPGGRLAARRRLTLTLRGRLAASLGALVLLLLLDQRRGRRDRAVALDHERAQHRVVELERALELAQRLEAALDVHEHVVRLVDLVDGIGELAPAPVFQPVDLAVAALDERAVALDHGGHLLALVRMDQEHDFVVTHDDSSRIKASRRCGEARSDRTRIAGAGKRGIVVEGGRPRKRAARARRAPASGVAVTRAGPRTPGGPPLAKPWRPIPAIV